MDCIYIVLFYLTGQGASLHIGTNLGFSVLLKDTSTHGYSYPCVEVSGIELPTWRLMNDPLYLLGHSCPVHLLLTMRGLAFEIML